MLHQIWKTILNSVVMLHKLFRTRLFQIVLICYIKIFRTTLNCCATLLWRLKAILNSLAYYVRHQIFTAILNSFATLKL